MSHPYKTPKHRESVESIVLGLCALSIVVFVVLAIMFAIPEMRTAFDQRDAYQRDLAQERSVIHQQGDIK